MTETAKREMPRPKATIRRFDVFAEYSKQRNERRGMSGDRAKGYALWLAKVIAARKFAKTEEKVIEMNELLGAAAERLRAGAKHLELDGQQQTGALFDRQISKRMGDDFYREVFAPAIKEAVRRHDSYEEIRDAIREPWNLTLEHPLRGKP